MVLGLRTKNRKSPTVQLDYLIHVQEVKPWPPSQSLKSLRSVLIQWEHGDRNSGSTNPVVPFLGSGIGDGRIEFNESFRLPVTLLREMSTKGGDGDTFQKNCIEFNLNELRRDKTVKGQLLGTAIVDLADYGVVKETLSISVPMNSKRSISNTAQPVLFIKIQSIEKGRSRNLSKEASMERNDSESVSALMGEEYAEEAEIASIPDDDVSSHSSSAVSSSAFEMNGGLSSHGDEYGWQAMKDNIRGAHGQYYLTSKKGIVKSDAKPVNELHGSLMVSSSCPSTNLSSHMGCLENCDVVLSNFPETSFTLRRKKITSHSVRSSSSSITEDGKLEMLNTKMRSKDNEILVQDVEGSDGRSDVSNNALQGSEGNISNGSLAGVAAPDCQADEKLSFAIPVKSQVNRKDSDTHEGATADVIHNDPANDRHKKDHQENGKGKEILQEGQYCVEDDTRKLISSGNDALSVCGEDLGCNILTSDKLKQVKSVRSLADSGRSNGSVRRGKSGDAYNGPQSVVSHERKDTKVYPIETRNITSDARIQRLEHRIKILEGELREAAAIEVGLYSVVAEHGSSINKVHAPARRLSRLYLHACKEKSQSSRASAARSAVSGLVLVAKACGNDVPRLTFWLSNSVVLRAIISQSFADHSSPLSAGSCLERPGGGKGNHKTISSLKWMESSLSKNTKGGLFENFDDWDDPRKFACALEKTEAWIFSRIIQSVWWQTLTPHMQSAAAKAINKGLSFCASKTYQRTSSSGDQDQVNVSLELWKKAFKDACERLCPLRAGGHECGCLPVLPRLIMEQCVARLDVAMFNAILRESDDETPTDPVSDPISESKVLPIPAGKASFGAGAQLKTAIGNWSRWLTDLFGIDDGDSPEDKNDYENEDGDERKDHAASFKSFHLLNALSDLMMLPKDLLLSRSIRKEVCPTFGTPLIKTVLNNFVPDDFCPDPIPKVVLEALEIEDPLESGEGSVTNVPCSAAPIVYLPPPAASVAGIIGGGIGSQSQLRRSGSSLLKKSYTSDDELDELDSPLSAIVDRLQGSPTATKPSSVSKENGSRNSVRYQLLRRVWMNSE